MDDFSDHKVCEGLENLCRIAVGEGQEVIGHTASPSCHRLIEEVSRNTSRGFLKLGICLKNPCVARTSAICVLGYAFLDMLYMQIGIEATV